jgi:hypothetical protein
MVAGTESGGSRSDGGAAERMSQADSGRDSARESTATGAGRGPLLSHV